MELGVALDGEGRLGHPGAVGAIARAADQLDYSSVWCIGPWAASLAGAVLAVTSRVRVGLDPGSLDRPITVGELGSGRVVVGELLRWPQGLARPPRDELVGGPRRLDATTDDLEGAAQELRTARQLGVVELVVRLTDDPGVDGSLAFYAELGALAEAPEPNDNHR